MFVTQALGDSKLLGEWHDNFQHGYWLDTEVGVNIQLGWDIWPDSGISWDVTVNDVGKTFPATSSTDPYFDEVVSLLTNGQPDLIESSCWMIPTGGGNATGTYDYFITKTYPAEPYTDFQGFEITEITLTVNGQETIYIDNRPLCHLDTTYRIYGVPEPATMILFGLGGIMLLRKKH
jgi:hypothetical protein